MKKVLIADDYPDNAEMLSLFLQSKGYETHLAFDGEEALETSRHRLPNALILDIGMPKLDGFDLAREIRKSKAPHPLIIGCSGVVEPEYFERARDCGFDFYVPKPVDPGILLACLEPEKYPSLLTESILIKASRGLRSASTEMLLRPSLKR